MEKRKQIICLWRQISSTKTTFCNMKRKKHLSLWPGLSARGDTEGPRLFLKHAGRIISIDPPICIPVCLGQTVCLSLSLSVGHNPQCHCTKSGGHGSFGQEFIMGQQLGPTQGDGSYCLWKGIFSAGSQPWRSGLINANISAFHRAEVVD